MPSKSLIIIPTYNEKENVSDIIDAVLAQDERFNVLIIDDNSPDRTDLIVEEKMKTASGRLHMIKRSGKLGLGTAYIEGFRYGIKHGFDYIFEMDADFSHNPKDLIRLLNACEIGGADLAIGSRYVKGGGLKDWPFDRKLLSMMASLYVRIITFMPVKDPTAGFKCYSVKVLKTLQLDKIKFIGYAFQIEMKYASYLNGFKIKEVPIIFKDREKGQSKMSSHIISEAIKGVLFMRVNALKGYYGRG
jgi:dolichol-phosphate mannosyltransferase